MKAFKREIGLVKKGEISLEDFAVKILKDVPAYEMALTLAELLVEFPGSTDYAYVTEKTLVSREAYGEIKKLFDSIAEKPKDNRGRKPKKRED